MKQSHLSNPTLPFKTSGTLTFTTCSRTHQPLFLVNPGIPVESALEHASHLLACINELSLDAGLGDGSSQTVWAVHYLSDMARAIVDDALSGSAALS